MEPGIPIKNSNPPRLWSTAKTDNSAHDRAAPASKIPFSSYMFLNHDPSMITTPRMPPERTSTLDIAPNTVIGISSGNLRKNVTRSSMSSGVNR